MRKKKSQLKIYIETNEETNKKVRDCFLDAMAEIIYHSQEFQNYMETTESGEIGNCEEG